MPASCTPRTHVLFVVRTCDIARACIAATSLRRHHPDWFQWLFIHHTLPAPWEDVSAGVFDARVTTSELPPSASLTTRDGRSAKLTWRSAALVERAFALLFEAGADSAVWVDAHHVWMRPLPLLQEALETHDIVLWNADLVAVRGDARPERLSAALARAFSPAEFDQTGSGHNFPVLDDPGFGLDQASLEKLPLHFSPEGDLWQGDQPVTTVNFRDSATTEFEARCSLPAFGTEWLELTKWYAGQLRRFGDDSAASVQLLRNQPG